MLEFEVSSAQMTMVFTATKIDKKNIPHSEFEIPEDFDIKTQEEVDKMFGSGGFE